MARKRITTPQKITFELQPETTGEYEQLVEAINKAAASRASSPTQWTVARAFRQFEAYQTNKGNSAQTINFYKSFYRKYSKFVEEYFHGSTKEADINILESEFILRAFIGWIQDQDVSEQTINAYLRGYRAFGKFCLEREYIKKFHCSISEVQPPVKEVYSQKELEALMKRPSISDFVNFRCYCVISLILNTGARCNTILNIKIKDIDFETGYITFNTLKNRSVVRLGLEHKTQRDLADWVETWRLGKDATKEDYLFCNEYGEQLSRSTLTQSIARYNRAHGVEKTSLHLLRHTYAKNWITSGGDIVTLAQVLTHKELNMVKRYANLYNTDVKKAIEVHSTIAQMKQKSGNTLKTRCKLNDT